MDNEFDVVIVDAGPVGTLTGRSPGDVAVARLADIDMGDTSLIRASLWSATKVFG
jgi:hypothetical protein